MPHIAFDIGNVLCHCDMQKYKEQITKLIHCNRDGYYASKFEDINYLSKFFETIEKLDYLGMINRKEHLQESFNISNEQSEYIADTWNEIVYPNDQMMNFLSKLKNENIKIALLSNMGPDHAKYLRTKYPELFDKTIQHLSCDVGAFKPNKLFYQSFLMSNEEFAGCVYLDDVKENIIAGSKMKFEAIHFDLSNFKKPIELKKRLDEIYNKIVGL